MTSLSVAHQNVTGSKGRFGGPSIDLSQLRNGAGNAMLCPGYHRMVVLRWITAFAANNWFN
jgi:hypothetical protein